MDLVFTDPPYNALRSWNAKPAKKYTRLNKRDWFDNDNMSWKDFEIFLTEVFENFNSHSIYVCCDFRIYDLVKLCIEKQKYKIRHCIVWKKNVWGLGKRYRFQHEFIIYATKGNAPFFGDKSQSDVWEIDVDRKTNHKTPKPSELPRRAIINSSKLNDNVIDFFTGAGSTLIACEQEKRRFFGLELSPESVAVTLERFYKFTNKKPKLIN